MLDTSVASVNSAMQRARAAVDERVPERSQQETLRALGDDELRALVDRYVEAWERNDVEAFTALLTEDVSFAMPPLSSWYAGLDDIRVWAAASPLSGQFRWRTRLVQANGQPALAFYSWHDAEGAYLPFALNVLTLREGRVASVVAFIARSEHDNAPEQLERYPDEAPDPAKVERFFTAFGLPDRLPA